MSDDVRGVKIGYDLYTHQTYSQNRTMQKNIKKALKKDKEAFVKLGSTWCGGGAGCYDLGYIITQLIFKIGEEEFVSLMKDLQKDERIRVLAFIATGLEYGDNDYDGKMDNWNIPDNLPLVYEELIKGTSLDYYNK